MIKELEDEFLGKGEVRGFTFEQIASNDNGYIYKVDNLYYEIFKRKIRDTFDMDENKNRIITGKKVAYPSSNDFGVWAWTKFKLADAIYKLKQISEKKEIDIY